MATRKAKADKWLMVVSGTRQDQWPFGLIGLINEEEINILNQQIHMSRWTKDSQNSHVGNWWDLIRETYRKENYMGISL